MTPRLIAIATVVIAAVTFSATADAGGGGVRLNFGLPLGTFTAKPAHGGGGVSYDDVYARKAAARKAAAIAEKQAEAKAAAARKASRVAKVDEPAPVKVKPAAETVSSTSSSGSTALIDTANQAKAADQKTAAIEPVKDTETSTSAASTATTEATPAKAEPKKDEAKVEETKTAQSDKSPGCKKFIPAIGITVSVSCND